MYYQVLETMVLPKFDFKVISKMLKIMVLFVFDFRFNTKYSKNRDKSKRI